MHRLTNRGKNREAAASPGEIVTAPPKRRRRHGNDAGQTRCAFLRRETANALFPAIHAILEGSPCIYQYLVWFYIYEAFKISTS